MDGRMDKWTDGWNNDYVSCWTRLNTAANNLWKDAKEVITDELINVNINGWINEQMEILPSNIH